MMRQNWIAEEFVDIEDVIFLNISYTGIPPRRVQNAYINFMHDLIKSYGEDFLPKAWNIVDITRKEISQLINADPSEIAFVKNTAEGIGIIASGYPFETGDNIIVPDFEHASNLYPWLSLKPKGVEIRIIPNQNGAIVIEDIINKCDKNTKAVSISAVQFSTGFYIDLYKLGEFCSQNNILLIVDGIQAIGRLEIDVKKMNIDYLACGGNKGLLATFGAGFVYCSNRIVKSIYPPYSSYQSVKTDANDPSVSMGLFDLNWYDDARRLESGNLNYTGINVLKEGVRILNKVGISNIEKSILELEEFFRQGLSGLDLKVRFYPRENWSGIVFVKIPENKIDIVKSILKKYKIIATLRGGYIRLGINFYNTNEQITEVIKAMEEISKLEN